MKLFLHTLFGLLALIVGYPYGGSVFIAIMLPYLVYMVFKRNAIYLPALILHAASETSAFTIIFLSFIILSIINYRKLIASKLGVMFWLLISLLPVFLWLLSYRIIHMGEYPPSAFVYIGYYLSFFAFFYGVLISKSFNKKVLTVILISLVIVFLARTLELMPYARIVSAFTFFFVSASSTLIARKNKSYLLAFASIIAIISIFTSFNESPLTTTFVSMYGLGISLLYFYNHQKLIHQFTGFLPFVMIFFLYWYGINNYLFVDQISFDSIGEYNSWTDRISFKFFGDRAPFWAGGFAQIIEYKHLFPIPDIPDIVTTMQSGREAEITFGSHTTFIELVRKYGVIAGIVLSGTLIYMVLISRNVFLIKNLDTYYVPFFASAFAVTITLSLTGQFQIMPGYALMSLGVLGIAYGKYRISVKQRQLLKLSKTKNFFIRNNKTSI